jgi:hypothetical protein
MFMVVVMRCSWFVSVTGLKQHFAEVVYLVNRSILHAFPFLISFQVDVAAAAKRKRKQQNKFFLLREVYRSLFP